jgi:hypothetical protein
MTNFALRSLAGCLAFCVAACAAETGEREEAAETRSTEGATETGEKGPVAESKQGLDVIPIWKCFTFDPTLSASQISQNAIAFSGEGYVRWLCRLGRGGDSVTVYLWNISPGSNQPPQVLDVTSEASGDISGLFYIGCDAQTYTVEAFDNTVGEWENQGVGPIITTPDNCNIPK